MQVRNILNHMCKTENQIDELVKEARLTHGLKTFYDRIIEGYDPETIIQMWNEGKILPPLNLLR